MEMFFAYKKLLVVCLILHGRSGLIRIRAVSTNWETSQNGSIHRQRRGVGSKDASYIKAPEKEVVLGLLIPYNVTDEAGISGYSGGQYYAAAFMLAIEDINNRTDLLSNVKLRYVWNDTRCLVDLAIKSQIWQHCSFRSSERTGVDAFIGTGCKCTTAVRNAVAMNLPIISHMCLDPQLANRTIYPTFARTVAMYKHLAPTLISLFDAFKWKRVAVFIERSALHEDAAEYVVWKMKQENMTIAVKHYLPSPPNYVPMLNDSDELVIKMRDAKRKARIILFLTSYPIAREALYVAFTESMINGEYAFIVCMKDVDEVKRNLKHQFKWYISHFTQTLHTSLDAKKALEAALILAPKLPEAKYSKFIHRLKTAMGMAPFFSNTYIGKVNGTHMEKSQSAPPLWGARAYDAVQLYALGLNKTLQQGKHVRDGRALINNIRSTTFRSILGHDIFVDENGEVGLNYTVLEKRGKRVEKIGEFVLEHPVDKNTSKVKRKVKLVLSKKIMWPGDGTVPRDSPKCGFEGEKCLPDPQQKEDKGHLFMAIAVALSIVGIVLFIIPVVMYRQYRLERELTSQLWKIDPNDLYVYDGRAPSCSSFGSITSNSWSIIEKGPREKFTTVAIYKGNFVAVKKVNKRTVELGRNVLMELKQMRDIRHENVNMFIGACTEPENILIVTQYASKGSLQDVLENETIKLDNLFILSLLYDIVKGLLYLNTTEIRVHGNLKSSNCVIDSRWVLKLTDFGLYHFKAKQENGDMQTREYYKSLLWCAPELLREEPYCPHINHKHDVYSFAIILQECHTREGAWSGTYMEPQDIVERVRFLECPPFRPAVPHLIEKVEGLRDLMKRCWLEEPDDRPSVFDIRKEIESMMRHNGLKRNIFDNMIYMMERYTENLEELVECKTGELLEEKRKTEALLERMLPITVAKQLKKGQAVEAEHFSDVTIYFSDIVGFTSLCAECTPMQVVNILNDLYTLFDDVIKGYDVYKVETIGDAYMVASGLPIRNGQQHAKEIALMSLHILSEVQGFTIRHKPGYKLKLRIGVHTGPVVAGVVGTVMPRYCLFGDTVNTSSRMETTGLPLKVHVSESTGEALLALGGFQLEKRGEVFLKGKGNVNTFWLIDAEESLKRTRLVEDERHKCHNAKIGSQFSMALLRNSPSLRAKLLSSGLSGTPRGTPKDSVNNSPSILNCNSSRRKKKMEFDTIVTAERVQLLRSNSPKGLHYENGETVNEEISAC